MAKPLTAQKTHFTDEIDKCCNYGQTSCFKGKAQKFVDDKFVLEHFLKAERILLSVKPNETKTFKNYFLLTVMTGAGWLWRQHLGLSYIDIMF